MPALPTLPSVIASDARGTTVKIGRHGVRQDAAQLLQPQEQAARQAEGPRGQDPRRASGRQPAPDVARPSPSCTRIDASKVTWVNIEPAAKIAALAEKRIDGVGDYTHRPAVLREGRRQRQRRDDAVGRLRLRHLLACRSWRSEKTMKERPKVLKAFLEASYMGWRDVMADPKGVAGDLQEARARDRPRDHRAEHDARPRPDEDRALRRERHRLDRRQEDVRLGRPREHLHGPAEEGRLQGRLHDRVPDQGRMPMPK